MTPFKPFSPDVPGPIQRHPDNPMTDRRYRPHRSHNDPYEQRRVMPSAGLFCLVRSGQPPPLHDQLSDSKIELAGQRGVFRFRV